MADLLHKYREIVGLEMISQLEKIAKELKGIKILHINSTKEGGGVAEILSSMIPLTEALGIENQWEVIGGNEPFFACTKQFHNGLQGVKNFSLNRELLDVYEKVNKQNAESLEPLIKKADVVFIHDPQPAALIQTFKDRSNKWIWRCHIDVSNPHPGIWDYLSGFIKQYDASIFSLADYVQPLPHPTFIIPPSIDPLTEKNRNLDIKEISDVYTRFGIDPTRPMILQVSRFDYFKDPLGVIEGYKLAKKFNPGLQLVLAGGGAHDDPEGERVLNEVKEAAVNDKDVHILFLPADAHRTINALQRAAEIVLQKSLKEGFGLTISEALWKNKPVIGGNVGGIRLQVINYQTGFLVDSPKSAAEKICYFLENPDQIKEMGRKGHQFILENFLLTRHLKDYLTLITSLVK